MASGRNIWHVSGIYNSGNYGKEQEQLKVKQNIANGREILYVPGKDITYSESCANDRFI